MNNFDYLIIGGGIAGLYTAYKIHQNQPHVTIGLLEATSRLGGRIHTIHKSNTQFESGGARFNSDQHRVLTLIKELDLSKQIVPITSTSEYIPVEPKYDPKLETQFPTIDDFIKHIQTYIKDKNISNQELLDTTILEFANTHFEKTYPTIKTYLESRYPYYSELGVLNAVEGINLFTNEFASKTQYFVLAKGLETLIDKLANKLRNTSKVMMYLETPLDTITYDKITKQYTIKTTAYQTIHHIPGTPKEYYTKNLILAIPQNALKKINYLTKYDTVTKMLKAVQSQQLYRIYACYPLDKKTGKPWFSELSKIVTNLPIKYIIPYDVKKGLIMISYTDGKYADYWLKHLLNGTFMTTLSKQLKQLFPEIDIPKPKWIQHCHWAMGAAYWLPGYNREEIMPKLVKPFVDESLYICGENYSSHQAWMEGSLETSDLVLNRILKTSSKLSSRHEYKNTEKKTKKQLKLNKVDKLREIYEGGSVKREYTLEEVAKHNKKTDAWIVIGDIVANITEWIPKHPGGDIIMKGVGKDASQLFNSIGHDAFARKMLKKYQIGILKK